MSVYQPACHESNLNFSFIVISLQDPLHPLKGEAIKRLVTPFRYAHTYYNNNNDVVILKALANMTLHVHSLY